MMWGLALLFVCYVAAQAASQEIKVKCEKFHDFPPEANNSPSFLADLQVQLLTVGNGYNLTIRWAINIDSTNEYLTGTRIVISGDSAYHCKYHPPLAKANLTEKQIWFHYSVSASYGLNLIQAANLPLPPLGSGRHYKPFTITVPRTKTTVTTTTIVVESTTLGSTSQHVPFSGEGLPARANFACIAIASLLILSSCFIVYKSYKANFAKSLGFKMLQFPVVPVPVLMVYPAENSAFQRAVVALAEFLQWHGGCSVTVDMWQQEKIAELGPMRWLAQQARAADQVLIVCPQNNIPSSQPSSQPSDSPESSIPAAAHDLYPLILNMVASNAKSTSNLAKFWVVQLGEEQAKKPNNLALELRVCKNFCLMKDLIKLCRSLHDHKQDGKKISNQIFIPGFEKNTVKLRKAVEKLGGHQSSNVDIEDGSE